MFLRCNPMLQPIRLVAGILPLGYSHPLSKGLWILSLQVSQTKTRKDNKGTTLGEVGYPAELKGEQRF